MEKNEITKDQAIANMVIDYLGGTSAVADMCELTTGAVSQWRTSKTGIPRPWMKFFLATNPIIEKVIG